MKKEAITGMIFDSIETHKTLQDHVNNIDLASDILISTLKQNNKILICGNGGSAAQAQHFAAELIGRFESERKSIPCISLTTDTSNITAIGNDYGFDKIFKRQIESLGNENDVLICLTTSGNSQNLVEAIIQGKKNNLKIINLIGKDGGLIKNTGNLDIIIRSQNSARIQEAHILILHIFAKLIEEHFLDYDHNNNLNNNFNNNFNNNNNNLNNKYNYNQN